jgi:hypothetical protein
VRSESRAWRRMRELRREQYEWPPERGGLEVYEPYVVYEADDGLQLGLAYLNRPAHQRGKDRKMVWVFQVGHGGETPGRPLTPFFGADDYDETHELIAYIRGKGESGRGFYGRGDTLPAGYAGFRIEDYQSRIAGGFDKFCVVVDEGDTATMLTHAAVQIAHRGL